MAFKITYLIYLIAFIFIQNESIAQSSGDYQTYASGNWNGTTVWQKYNGTSWATTATAPGSGSGVITILSGNTITITANVTADQIVVSAGGEIIIKDGITLTLNNGIGTDLDVYGTLQEIGTGATGASITINAGATIVFESTGLYLHDFSSTSTQGAIPIATWNTGSTCEVIGFVSPTTNHIANLNQSFSNFTWNCPNQTVAYGMTGQLTTVRGNFTMASSGNTPQVVYGLGADNGSANFTLAIGDSMIITGGIFDFVSSVGNSGTYTLNIGGGYSQSGGTFQSDCTDGLAVNFTGAAGTYTKTGGTLTSTNMNFNVNNGAILTLDNNIAVSTSFTVSNGGTLYADTNVVSGAGTFTLSSGGTLGIGSPYGITSSGASGNIQVTSSRASSFNTGAGYIYDGVVAQVSGNGLPSQVANLTLVNANNATLTASTSVSGIMTFTSGIWIATTDTLTLGISTTTLGTLSVVNGWVDGYFRRWVAAATASNVLFPVGTLAYYNAAYFSFTTAPTTGGSIVSTFIPTNPGTNGLPLTDAGDVLVDIGYGYWNFGAANSFASATYTVNLEANGFPGITDYTELHIVQRTNSAASWTLNGTHSAGTGSNTAPVANRSGMTLLGNYGIASPSVNPLPVELLSFDATPEATFVKLTWITASEINNDFFTIERSRDGVNFEEVLKTPGAGNSTKQIGYTANDNEPLKGLSYYRLKQTDFDGNFVYFPVKAVDYNAVNSNNQLIIYTTWPNPLNDSFTINYSLAERGEVSIQMVNILGQLVYSETINGAGGFNSFSFKLNAGLLNGMYFVNIISGNAVVTEKVNKE